MKSRGTELQEQILAEYVLTPSERLLLEKAATTADELGRLEEALAAAPVTVPGSKGQERPHPLLGEVRSHRRTLEALLRALALPVIGEEVGRVRSPRHAAAAAERWRRQARGAS